ncbi:hypothetical protein VNO78_16780 [Psophocarpus tetragonolobus]|uniref:Uncharacterized protein n=1 Tax=Psophocarpus tetragonolobus TaxID=3891 RepID=A0AAN9SIQ3_PSOTE
MMSLLGGNGNVIVHNSEMESVVSGIGASSSCPSIVLWACGLIESKGSLMERFCVGVNEGVAKAANLVLVSAETSRLVVEFFVSCRGELYIV